MPELPEVETIRRGLLPHLIGQTISEVEVRKSKIVSPDISAFSRILEGNAFADLQRRGKLLIGRLEQGEYSVLIHLKMTGQLIWRDPSGEQVAGGHPWPEYNAELPNKYSHIIVSFANGARLFFNDLRQFGFWKLATPEEVAAARSRYGLEPLTEEFTLENFSHRLTSRKGILKSVLLNQEIFSGLGNIYVDEVCFYAQVRPERRIETLTPEEIGRLHAGCQTIIAHAIEQRGTTVESFTDASGQRGNYSDFLQVYKQEGKLCQRCGQAKIVKTKLAGRGTHYCPNCQY